jgi:hypothetical protein
MPTLAKMRSATTASSRCPDSNVCFRQPQNRANFAPFAQIQSHDKNTAATVTSGTKRASGAAASRLRRWGLELASRGGKNGKKRAVIAVARKLAVLLHKLWSTGQVYEPMHGVTQAA